MKRIWSFCFCIQTYTVFIKSQSKKGFRKCIPVSLPIRITMQRHSGPKSTIAPQREKKQARFFRIGTGILRVTIRHINSGPNKRKVNENGSRVTHPNLRKGFSFGGRGIQAHSTPWFGRQSHQNGFRSRDHALAVLRGNGHLGSLGPCNQGLLIRANPNLRVDLSTSERVKLKTSKP